MNEIKILSDRIIIDGHADTREQCETATMLANLLLAQGSGFNCVEYRSGYAEFKKSDVVKLADSELKFVSGEPVSYRTIYVNGNSVEISDTMGSTWQELELYNSDYSIKDNTVVWNDGTILQYNGVDVLPSDNLITNGQYTTRSAYDGKINITKSAGVVLKTQGKYCDQDITVVPTLEEKSVTPTESAQEIVPSDGKCGISKVNVGAVQTETKTITPTTSQQTFTPTSGKYFKQVICQAIQAYQGTATPAQGEQTITPTSGKFFSSFKVGAIPSDYVIPSGTLQITANGAKDVTNYKNVNVNVEPNLEEKTVTVTTNGTTEVTPTSGKDGISKVTINTNVPTASAVEEVATASAMDALLVEANVGKYYKFTGTTDSNYTNGDLYLVEVGAVTEHTLTYKQSVGITATVNGQTVTSPYTLTENCTIVISCSNDYLTVNGTTYNSSQTIALSGVDIVCESSLSAPGSVTVTINYTA